MIFNDENGNGVRDAGEAGAPGFQVGLYRAAELGFPTTTATSDAGGRFNLVFEYAGKIAQSERLLLVAEGAYAPQGYVWRTNFVSNPFQSIPDANDLRPLRDGATFDVVFGKQLVTGTAPQRQVPGEISVEELLRTTPPPRPGGGVEGGGETGAVTRLPSTGSGGSKAAASRVVLDFGLALVSFGAMSAGVLAATYWRGRRGEL